MASTINSSSISTTTLDASVVGTLGSSATFPAGHIIQVQNYFTNAELTCVCASNQYSDLGTFNVSIGEKVYLNQIVSWLNKYNQKKLKIIKHNFSKNQSFYLNNKKLMSKIKIKNNLLELKKDCLNLSKKLFN